MCYGASGAIATQGIKLKCKDPMADKPICSTTDSTQLSCQTTKLSTEGKSNYCEDDALGISIVMTSTPYILSSLPWMASMRPRIEMQTVHILNNRDETQYLKMDSEKSTDAD